MTIRRNCILLSAALAAGSCASNSAVEVSQEWLAEGYLLQAFEVIDAERHGQLERGGSVDAVTQAHWEELEYQMLVHLARQAIYRDDEFAGMDLLARAETARAGTPAVAELIMRARRKLADRAVRTGQELLAKAQLDGALAAFVDAQTHVADHPGAAEGIAAVHAQVARLHAEAQQQFLEAIRKLPQFRYPEAGWHATAALARDRSRQDAAQVRQRATREQAESTRLRAEANRAVKHYGAALMEYRACKSLWPEMPGIGDFIAQMEREVDVVGRTERAQLAIKASRLDEARKLLDEAFEMSTLERGTISELRYMLRRRAGEDAYEAARDLELQGHKQQALAAFEAMSTDWPDGLLDERTRIGALRSDLAAAEREFAAGQAAEAKGALAEALEHYEAARTFYPRHQDVAACIERVTKKLGAQGPTGQG